MATLGTADSEPVRLVGAMGDLPSAMNIYRRHLRRALPARTDRRRPVRHLLALRRRHLGQRLRHPGRARDRPELPSRRPLQRLQPALQLLPHGRRQVDAARHDPGGALLEHPSPTPSASQSSPRTSGSRSRTTAASTSVKPSRSSSSGSASIPAITGPRSSTPTTSPGPRPPTRSRLPTTRRPPPTAMSAPCSTRAPATSRSSASPSNSNRLRPTTTPARPNSASTRSSSSKQLGYDWEAIAEMKQSGVIP